MATTDTRLRDLIDALNRERATAARLRAQVALRDETIHGLEEQVQKLRKRGPARHTPRHDPRRDDLRVVIGALANAMLEEAS